MWFRVHKRVFSRGWYALLSALLFFIGMSLVLLLPNSEVIGQVFASEAVSLGTKISFVWSLYGSIGTNFTVFSAFYTLVVVLLFAINLTLFVFYIRRAQKQAPAATSAKAGSLAGIVSGVLGVGCAACGSVILTGLAASTGATGLLLALPLHGGELALFGIVFLVWSIHHLVKKINDPLVCGVTVRDQKPI